MFKEAAPHSEKNKKQKQNGKKKKENVPEMRPQAETKQT